MASRVCPGCGRRAPADFDVCLACGTDIGTSVWVSTVTAGALPPSPPDASAAWPVTATSAPFTKAQEIARWLAAAGQAAVAVVYVVAVLGRLQALDDGLSAMAALAIFFGALLAATFARLAVRIITRPDLATLRGAIGVSVMATLLFATEASASPSSLRPVAIGIAFVPGIAGVLAIVARQLLVGSIPERVPDKPGWP